jgi:hypothetical protein
MEVSVLFFFMFSFDIESSLNTTTNLILKPKKTTLNLPFRSLRVNFSAGGRGWCRLLLIFIPPVAAAAGALKGRWGEKNKGEKYKKREPYECCTTW